MLYAICYYLKYYVGKGSVFWGFFPFLLQHTAPTIWHRIDTAEENEGFCLGCNSCKTDGKLMWNLPGNSSRFSTHFPPKRKQFRWYCIKTLRSEKKSNGISQSWQFRAAKRNIPTQQKLLHWKSKQPDFMEATNLKKIRSNLILIENNRGYCSAQTSIKSSKTKQGKQ